MANYMLWRICADAHRELADLANCQEAAIYHQMWAVKYEQLIRDHTDYFAITRAVSA